MGCRCLLLPSSFFLMFNCPRGLPRWLSGRATGDAGLSLGQEDLLEKGMVTHPSILAWRIIAWTEELGGLKSMGSQRVRHMTEWLSMHSCNCKRRNGCVCVNCVCSQGSVCVWRRERGRSWWHRTSFSVPMAGITQAAHFSQGWLWLKPPYKFQKFLARKLSVFLTPNSI